MISLQQLSELSNSDRLDVIHRLQSVADEYGLSYTITSDAMTIQLPDYDKAELPIVGRINGDDLEAPDSTGGD